MLNATRSRDRRGPSLASMSCRSSSADCSRVTEPSLGFKETAHTLHPAFSSRAVIRLNTEDVSQMPGTSTTGRAAPAAFDSVTSTFPPACVPGAGRSAAIISKMAFRAAPLILSLEKRLQPAQPFLYHGNIDSGIGEPRVHLLLPGKRPPEMKPRAE